MQAVKEWLRKRFSTVRDPDAQVWIISEPCGQGTLETAIARGWLRKGSSALGKAEAGPDLPAILSTAQVGRPAARMLRLLPAFAPPGTT